MVLDLLNPFSNAGTLQLLHNRMWWSWNFEVHVFLNSFTNWLFVDVDAAFIKLPWSFNEFLQYWHSCFAQTHIFERLAWYYVALIYLNNTRSSVAELQSFPRNKIGVDPRYRVLMFLPSTVQILWCRRIKPCTSYTNKRLRQIMATTLRTTLRTTTSCLSTMRWTTRTPSRTWTCTTRSTEHTARRPLMHNGVTSHLWLKSGKQ